MAIDVLKLFADRPMAIERGRLEALAERWSLRLAAGDGSASSAHDRQAAAMRSRPFTKTPTGEIAIVQLTGVISPTLPWWCDGTSPDVLLQNLREAASAAPVIVLVIDSPGGSVDLIQETAATIRAIGAQTPIIALARCLAASAAYWVASASR